MDRYFDSLVRQRLPETVVLLITTHGIIIKKDNDTEVNTFTIPPGMTVTRSLAASIGVCNFVDTDMTVQYADLIDSEINNLTNNDEETQYHAILAVADGIKEIDVENVEGIKSMIEELKEEIKRDSLPPTSTKAYDLNLRQNYMYSYDRSYRIQTFRENQEMVNKRYLRNNNEKTRTDWVIKAMNLEHQPDLLSFIRRQSKLHDSVTTLDEIVSFFHDKGVKNLIIFDVSCSNITDEDQVDVSNRTTRLLSRKIDTRKYGGKKRKSYRRQKRNKSRRLYKHKKRKSNKRV